MIRGVGSWIEYVTCQNPKAYSLLMMLSWTRNISFTAVYKLNVSKVGDRSRGDLKVPFSIATTPRCRGRRYSFSWIVPLYLDTYLILLSVKQGGIKYNFKSLIKGSFFILTSSLSPPCGGKVGSLWICMASPIIFMILFESRPFLMTGSNKNVLRALYIFIVDFFGDVDDH